MSRCVSFKISSAMMDVIRRKKDMLDGKIDLVKDFEVGRSYKVYVTHINNPHSFYVRPVDADNFLESIELPGPIKQSATEVQLGEKVIYKSKTLGKYVRGNVCYIEIDGQNANFDIYAMDYGCMDKSVLLEYIYSPYVSNASRNQRPGLALHCRLDLCEPKGDTFSEKDINDMKSFVSEHPATVTVTDISNDQLIVELITVECPVDVAMMMGLLHYTTFLKGSNQLNRMYKSTLKPTNLTHKVMYKHKQINVGDTFHVRVQSGTSMSSFYVAEVNEFKKIVSDQNSFSMYCKSRRMKDEDIVPGIACGVKLDNLDIYERAIIKDVLRPHSIAVLVLVDWGKEIKRKFSCIRSVASEIYVTKPICAIYCSVSEDKVWATSLPKFLFPGYEFGIRIMELGYGFDQPHKVDLFPI